MSQWEAKGTGRCLLCGITARMDTFTENKCTDTEWCSKQRAVPNHIAAHWGSIQDDLQQGGAAAFEVGSRRFMLVDIGRTGELVGMVVEEVDNAA